MKNNYILQNKNVMRRVYYFTFLQVSLTDDICVCIQFVVLIGIHKENMTFQICCYKREEYFKMLFQINVDILVTTPNLDTQSF